jgi:Asp-tRNA(Asn)/Glu-tRNA(Gln) amidotransferase A subunit family amidase
LPISVKDGFQIAGTAATIGFVSFLDHALSETNSPLVEILLELGAVVYVKTNIPQTLMASIPYYLDLDKDHGLMHHRREIHITTYSEGL